MKKTILIMTVLLMTIALPIIVQGQQIFDMNGQAIVPDVVGGDISAYCRIFDPFPGVCPIALDFATYEFTLVIEGLTFNADGNFYGGTIALYQDDATPSDFTNTSTFTDGTVLLSGVVPMLQRTMFTSSLGSAYGAANLTGGTRLDEIGVIDRLDWSIVAGINAMPSFVEDGYSENWDGKFEPKEPIIATEATTWNNVKTMFR
jgi:hypothetical protein